jgi:hypothetical protein
MVVAVLCGILVTTTVYWKGDYLSESKNAILNAVTVAKTIDLSRYGATRGMEQEQPDRTISLPRATIDLDLILPYFSQPGQYRVTVASERGAASPVVSVSGVAQTVTARTELKITLNLRDLPSGKYYLGTIEQSNGESYFYPVNLD